MLGLNVCRLYTSRFEISKYNINIIIIEIIVKRVYKYKINLRSLGARHFFNPVILGYFFVIWKGWASQRNRQLRPQNCLYVFFSF